METQLGHSVAAKWGTAFSKCYKDSAKFSTTERSAHSEW